MTLLTKDYSGSVKAAEKGEARAVSVTITTQSVDRDGDIVVASGIDIRSFQKNPVVLWQHDHKTPIARATQLQYTESGIEAEVLFPAAGVCAKSDEVYGLIQAGVVNASSIGFMPVDYDYDENLGGFMINESELYEFSFVSVPSNRDALITQRSALSKSLPPKKIGSTEQRARQIESITLRGMH